MNKVRLGDIAIQIRGVSYKPDDILSENDDNSIGILRANNIQEELDLSDIVYIRKDRVKDYQLLKKEDILICASSGSKNLVGKAVRIPYDLNLSFGAFCKVVRTKGTINSDYLSCFFQSDYYRNYISNIAEGANINNIKNEHIDNLLLNTPNESNQLFYSKILLSLFSIIKAKKKQIEKLDELIKSRFVEMFGEPIDNPMSWDTKRLKDISILITNGNTPKGGSENYVDDGIVFLRSQNIWRNRIDLTDVAFIDKATNQKMRKSIVKHKDILITKTGRINTENSSLGRAALYLGEDNSANINGHVYLVRLNDSVIPEYIVTILTGEAYRKYIRKVCVGGIDKRQINLDQVEEFPIIMPPKHLQQQFADFVSQVEKQKATVQQSINKLETLKKSLMQEYFG